MGTAWKWFYFIPGDGVFFVILFFYASHAGPGQVRGQKENLKKYESYA